MLIEFDNAVGEIALLMERRGQGDFSEDALGKRFPAFVPSSAAARPTRSGVSLTQLVQVWSNRLQMLKPQTIKGYGSFLQQLSAFLGHEDTGSVFAGLLTWLMAALP